MVFMCLHFKECVSLKDNIPEALPWCILSSLGKLCWCKCSWLLHRRWTLLFLDKTCPSFCCIIISRSSFFSNSSIEKLITWTNCRPPNDPFLSISLSVLETKDVVTLLWPSVGVKPNTWKKVRIWSPSGLTNVQSSTARPKTPRIEVFLVSLERSWSVDVENGLALTIWTSVAQVMGKRRAGSQTSSLSLDY